MLETSFPQLPSARVWPGCGSDVAGTWLVDVVQTVWQKLRERGFQQERINFGWILDIVDVETFELLAEKTPFEMTSLLTPLALRLSEEVWYTLRLKATKKAPSGTLFPTDNHSEAIVPNYKNTNFTHIP